jgi:hypothetical protein
MTLSGLARVLNKETTMITYAIFDWTGAPMFNRQQFETWEDAEEFLSEQLGEEYEEDRGEYTIRPLF